MDKGRWKNEVVVEVGKERVQFCCSKVSCFELLQKPSAASFLPWQHPRRQLLGFLKKQKTKIHKQERERFERERETSPD